MEFVFPSYPLFWNVPLCGKPTIDATVTDMQNAVSAGQVPGIELDPSYPQVFCLCHCTLEWKGESYQRMLTDHLQNQNFL